MTLYSHYYGNPIGKLLRRRVIGKPWISAWVVIIGTNKLKRAVRPKLVMVCFCGGNRKCLRPIYINQRLCDVNMKPNYPEGGVIKTRMLKVGLLEWLWDCCGWIHFIQRSIHIYGLWLFLSVETEFRIPVIWWLVYSPPDRLHKKSSCHRETVRFKAPNQITI